MLKRPARLLACSKYLLGGVRQKPFQCLQKTRAPLFVRYFGVKKEFKGMEDDAKAKKETIEKLRKEIILEPETHEEIEKFVMESELPVIVQFHAVWCGPCKQLAPILEKKVLDQEGGVILVKVNVEKNPEFAEQLDVSGVPALFSILKGNLHFQMTGLHPEEKIEEFVKNACGLANLKIQNVEDSAYKK
jgi:thioredoxin